MKVLLVISYSCAYQIIPDLGLGYLASALKKQGHSVEITDCVNRRITNEALLEYIKTKKPGLVGFKVFTKDLPVVKEALQMIKGYRPQIFTAAGGPHPSCTPETTLTELEDLDFCFYSDAEVGLCRLIDTLEEGGSSSKGLGEIPNLAWRSSNGIRVNENRIADDLDSLQFPLWEQMNPSDYPPAPQGFIFKSFPTAPIIATRGCPFDCTFCCGWRMGGKKIRYRSPENIVDEIEFLHRDFSVSEVHFEDDNFSLKRDYVIEVCKSIRALDFKLHWALPQGVRLSTLDEELLYIMREAGCYSFSLGIESGSQKILNDMKKKQTLSQVRDKLELIHKVGINSMGFFIIGYPTETVDDIKATIEFARSLPLDSASFNIFKPYPGTEVYERLQREERLGRLDWATFDYDKVSWDRGNIPHRQLKRMQGLATLSFYIRPRTFFNFFSKIKSWRQIFFLFKRIFSVILQRR